MKNISTLRIFDRIQINDHGCWIYQGGISSNGYGVVSVKNKSVGAHRVSYESRFGKIPDGMCVLHRCDVRSCINPDHLFLGTLGNNNSDRESKGRSSDRRGEKNTMAKLTDIEVEVIRHLASIRKLTQRQLAAMFLISQQHVSSLVCRRRR